MAQGVITEVGRKLLCRAHAGDDTLPVIAFMVFGSGGVDEKGNVIEPTGAEMALRMEIKEGRRPVESHSYTNDGQTACRYTARLGKKELAYQNISEQGLVDKNNNLVAYKTFLPKGKDDDMEFIFDMDEVF